MFEIGEYIVYGHNGICQVREITHPTIAGVDKNKLYYVLVPIKNEASRLFCPIDNDKIVIRKVITAEEAEQIICDAEDIEPMVIEKERSRDEDYREAMKSCDLRRWIQLLKTLVIRKNEREASGKKVTSTDERFMKAVQEGLYSELSMATGEEKDSICEKILEICNRYELKE